MWLLAFFVVHFTLTYVLRSVIVHRRTGIDPRVLPSRDDAYGYVGRSFKVVLLGIAPLVAADAVGIGAWHRLGRIETLETPEVRAIGWALLGL